ncbi:hypothetical protein PRIPAC_89184 [Pristionchus pacificus]|uniref:Uncharacterized protein n=1 Tax=Pristionchus pacificus TaxID=54126 RepID=A0A2A6B9P9_PRIPA|nr:hypothetical protein PRIPAC_89184 [Pristionchus pacificus]|eukprot:PDM62587.1 hypothetical protein PRIPAC_52029 [Pristionchus pacificus]
MSFADDISSSYYSSSPEVINIEPAEYYRKQARPVHRVSCRHSLIKKSHAVPEIITLSDDEDEGPKEIQPVNTVTTDVNRRDGREEPPTICITPVQRHWEQRGEQIKHLEYTHRELEMEYDAEYIRPKDHTEAFFTYIQDEELFFICMPFATNPIYQEVTFPVNENVIRELYDKLPPRWVHCLPELRHREGFDQFARYFHYRGSGYRLSALMRRAFNVVVRNPNALRILEKIAHECVSEVVPNPNVDDDYCRIRKGRAARDAANEIDGSTPYGCRQPMRPRVLFREEGMEKQPVKRRRLDLEMLD